MKKYEKFINAAKSEDEARPHLKEQTSTGVITSSADGYRIHSINLMSHSYNKELENNLSEASKKLDQDEVIAEITLDADFLLDAVKYMTSDDTSAITLRLKKNSIEVLGTIEEGGYRVSAYAVMMRLKNVNHSFSPDFSRDVDET